MKLIRTGLKAKILKHKFSLFILLLSEMFSETIVLVHDVFFFFELILSIYLPIMSNPCWGPRHMRVNLQEY